MSVPDTSTAAKRTAVAFEDGVRYSNLEHGVLIAPDGLVIAQVVGATNRVSFTVGQLLRVAGVTLSHNHPGGFGPSLDDVLLAAEYEFHELRVVTEQHRHGVEYLRHHHMASVRREFSTASVQAEQECRFDVFNCKLHPKDMGREVLHRTWVRLRMLLGFKYWREQS